MGLEQGRKLARHLIQTMPAIMRGVASRMRRLDEPMTVPHFQALMLITHGGPCTLTELAGRQHVSLPTMSNTVSVLVQRGWLERVADDADRRRTTVRLTEEGTKAVAGVREQLEGLLAAPLGELSPEESEQLRIGLDVLRRAFERAPSEAGGDAT